jgi:hypothetical protein
MAHFVQKTRTYLAKDVVAQFSIDNVVAIVRQVILTTAALVAVIHIHMLSRVMVVVLDDY